MNANLGLIFLTCKEGEVFSGAQVYLGLVDGISCNTLLRLWRLFRCRYRILAEVYGLW